MPNAIHASRPARKLSGSVVMIVSGWMTLLNCDAFHQIEEEPDWLEMAGT